MTALQIYTAVLHEIRSQRTGSLTPSEFNHHSMVGLTEWVRMKRLFYDVTHEVDDDLSPLVTITDGIVGNPAVIANTGGAVPGQEVFLKPVNYEWYISAQVIAKYLGDECNPANTYSEPIQVTMPRKDAMKQNYYLRPLARMGRVKISDNKNRFSVEPMEDAVADKMILTYVKKPTPNLLNETTGTVVSSCELTDSGAIELIQWITASVLENLADMRGKSYPQFAYVKPNPKSLKN